MNIENVRMTVEPVGDFALKGLHRSISATTYSLLYRQKCDLGHNVRLWHLADIEELLINVRFRG